MPSSLITASVQTITATTNLAVSSAVTVATWFTNVTRFRGQNGLRLSYSCPAKPLGGLGTVWGTDVYTDDSAICVAALHAGKITETGGTFTLEIRDGQASYTGSTRNGVTTSLWNAYGGSYVFVN